MDLISNNDELEELNHLENWCQKNHLLLNVSETKELIVDFARGGITATLRIDGIRVEKADGFKYLAVRITQDLSRSCPHQHLGEQSIGGQRLYHLRASYLQFVPIRRCCRCGWDGRDVRSRGDRRR